MYRHFKSSSPRFELFVKEAGDGGIRGTCPFSNKALMVMLKKVPESMMKVTPIDLDNKPEDFLQINPGGKTPFLIDSGESGDKTYIPDSAAIIDHITKIYPRPDMKPSVDSTPTDLTNALFQKFADYMKNQDEKVSSEKKEAFESELNNLEEYLKSEESKTRKYLLSDFLSEVDCQMLPLLMNIKVAAVYFKKLDLSRYEAVTQYLRHADEEKVWKQTHPNAQDIVDGWGMMGCIKEE